MENLTVVYPTVRMAGYITLFWHGSLHSYHQWINHARVSVGFGIKLASNREAREKVREVLRESDIPMDVENIRLRAGLKNWESTKAILLEMVLQGSILGQKTTKSWIFWINTPLALTQRQVKRRRRGLGTP